MNEMKLQYCQAAGRWEESLPIGNGSLGAMIMGGIQEEILGLNEETIWSGYAQDKNNPEAFEYLQKVRELMFEGKRLEAERLIQHHMLGEYNESYLPLGKLKIQFDHKGQAENYQRILDIDHSIAKLSYQIEGISYRREYFASYPAKAIFVLLKADKPKLEFQLEFMSELKHQCLVLEREIKISGKCPEHVDPSYIPDREDSVVQGTKGMEWNAGISIIECDGEISHDKAGLRVHNAYRCVLMISAVKEPAVDKTCRYEEVRQAHIRDYQNIYDKVELYLGEQQELPTDVRLENLKSGKPDHGLFALYFQYGRYLLISSSRKGSLPANLQGIWNWEMRAPWSCNWTVNINTEMNYWHALSCGLEECMEPYYRFVEKVCIEGRKTASTNYHCRGSAIHHNIDYWGNTSPVGLLRGSGESQEQCVNWAFWPLAGAWLIQELYRAYEYYPEEQFLREMVYPLTRDIALFLCDWLIEKDGKYVTCPSTSPENRYYFTENENVAVTIASAMDITLIREVFTHFRKICELLKIDDSLLEEIAEKEERLTTLKIGSRGQLLEWDGEYEEPEPGHRHISHLYGMFPSELFEGDKELTKACRISLQERLACGGGYTGWSCAWIINMFAVLGDEQEVYKYLNTLLTRSVYPNLWCAHPPFQIDGNFGGTAAMANMLVQDRGGKVKILPALPKQFQEGYVKGLCIKGGRKIDIEWKNSVEISHRIY